MLPSFLPCKLGGLTFLVLSLFIGCAGHSVKKPIEPNGNGYFTALPKPGTRVVLWGYNPGAVNQASVWLHKHNLVIVDRARLQQGFNENHVRLTGVPQKDEAHVLEAGKFVGAEQVIFIDANKVLSDRKFSFARFRTISTFTISVEVRGVYVENGEVTWQGNAWGSTQTQEPELLVKDLTTFALEKVWASTNSASEKRVFPRKEGNGAIMEEMRSSEIDSKSFSKKDSRKGLQPNAAESQGSEIGLQIASGALTLLYGPAKLIYAGLGGIVGGFAYVVSGGDHEVSNAIWTSSLQGTYYLSPSHLRGEEPIRFNGSSPRYIHKTTNREPLLTIGSAQ